MDELDKYMLEHQLDSDKWQEISARPICILVTGRIGTGKSSLINGLIGKNVTKVGEILKPETSKVEYFQRIVNGVPMRKSSLINGLIGKNMTKVGETLKPETSKVESFQRIVNGVRMIIFDSPGLQDGTDNEVAYVKANIMSEKCKKVDLILYTIKMTNTRMHEDDVYAMRNLTVAFGEEFWTRAMFVMTFANQVQDPGAPGEHDFKKNVKYFEKKLQEWKEHLPDVLSKRLGVSRDIASKVPIIPAGYYKVTHLPGRRFWFSRFWKSALDRMKEISEDRARFMLEYSKDRWQKVYELSKDDLEATIDKQPIYKQPESKGWFWFGQLDSYLQHNS